MPIAKHLIVEKGELRVTDKPMPEAPMDSKTLSNEFDPIGHDVVVREWSHYHEVELESWKQEALVVGNPEILEATKDFAKIGSKIPDYIYDAPAGLEYEVNVVCEKNCSCHDCVAECDSSKQVAILSFASPKEEAPIINKLEETIVEWLKSGDENATNLAYQIFFKHIERKETPASKEKPDFEKMAKQFVAHHVRPGKGYIGDVIFENMLPGIVEHTKRTMEFIYKAEVVPYQEQIAALQEEIRQLKNKQ